jgi:hypothetical protein
LTFEEQKSILKWYIKFENVAEVQRQWKREWTWPGYKDSIIVL